MVVVKIPLYPRLYDSSETCRPTALLKTPRPTKTTQITGTWTSSPGQGSTASRPSIRQK